MTGTPRAANEPSLFCVAVLPRTSGSVKRQVRAMDHGQHTGQHKITAGREPVLPAVLPDRVGQHSSVRVVLPMITTHLRRSSALGTPVDHGQHRSVETESQNSAHSAPQSRSVSSQRAPGGRDGTGRIETSHRRDTHMRGRLPNHDFDQCESLTSGGHDLGTTGTRLPSGHAHKVRRHQL